MLLPSRVEAVQPDNKPARVTKSRSLFIGRERVNARADSRLIRSQYYPETEEEVRAGPIAVVAAR